MQIGRPADSAAVDYTNWTSEELVKLRGLQRDDGADTAEIEAVERELQRRKPAVAGGVASTSLGSSVPPVSAPIPRTQSSGATSGSSAQIQPAPNAITIEPPPFSLHNGRRSFVSVLTICFVFVALAAGAGGGILTYALSDGLRNGRVLLSVVGGVVAAMPYLAVVAFMDLASEAAQGVTWIATFLHEQD
jgi:hypothetical protein